MNEQGGAAVAGEKGSGGGELAPESLLRNNDRKALLVDGILVVIQDLQGCKSGLGCRGARGSRDSSGDDLAIEKNGVLLIADGKWPFASHGIARLGTSGAGLRWLGEPGRELEGVAGCR